MKKLISLIVCLCILSCAFVALANDTQQEIAWDITDGILTVSGNGAMPDYRNEDDVPWNSRKSEITGIVVEDGITHIGNLAFYGLTNAKEAKLAESVKTIGLCAFSYSELTKSSIGDLDSPYQFKVESDSSVVSEGEEFTITITLTADYKELAGVQSILLFDRERISIDQEKWYDEEWFNSVNDTNLGYISKPLSGFVANNLRLMYLSTSGVKIDSESPLYTQGVVTLPIAKVKCTALKDIEDINTSCFAIKSSSVFLLSENSTATPASAETQLTSTVRKPMNITINGKVLSESIKEDISKEEPKAENEEVKAEIPKYDVLTVVANGNTVTYDVAPYENENGILMLPLRHTLEAMNATVTWDGDTQTAFIIYEGNLIALQINRNLIFRNDTSAELSTNAVIKDSRTMVPFDFIQSSFGFNAQYIKENNLVTIEK